MALENILMSINGPMKVNFRMINNMDLALTSQRMERYCFRESTAMGKGCCKKRR